MLALIQATAEVELNDAPPPDSDHELDTRGQPANTVRAGHRLISCWLRGPKKLNPKPPDYPPEPKRARPGPLLLIGAVRAFVWPVLVACPQADSNTATPATAGEGETGGGTAHEKRQFQER